MQPMNQLYCGSAPSTPVTSGSTTDPIEQAPAMAVALTATGLKPFLYQ